MHDHHVVVLTAGGVGYEVALTEAHLFTIKMGETLTLPTYLKVSDSALDLYGFENHAARDFFVLLLSVSGIGPKSALNILSLGSIESIQAAIARGDIAYLTAVQGMGKKTAERLVVELKSKIKKQETRANETGMADSPNSDVLGEVVEGLIAMGYSAAEARAAAQLLETTGKSTEMLLREALQKLAR